MRELTRRQREVLQYVASEVDDGKRPSYSDIAAEFGVSRSSARKVMEALARKRRIKRKYLSRSFDVIYRGP